MQKLLLSFYERYYQSGQKLSLIVELLVEGKFNNLLMSDKFYMR